MTHLEEAQRQLDEAVSSVARDLETSLVDTVEHALQVTPLPEGHVRILRTTGGPNIEIDTYYQMVIGYWGGKHAVQFFSQSLAQRIAEHCDLFGHGEGCYHDR